MLKQINILLLSMFFLSTCAMERAYDQTLTQHWDLSNLDDTQYNLSISHHLFMKLIRNAQFHKNINPALVDELLIKIENKIIVPTESLVNITEKDLFLRLLSYVRHNGVEVEILADIPLAYEVILDDKKDLLQITYNRSTGRPKGIRNFITHEEDMSSEKA